MSVRRDDRFGVGYLLDAESPKSARPGAATRIARDAMSAVTSGLSLKVLAAIKDQNGGETDVKLLIDKTGFDYDVVVPLLRLLQEQNLVMTTPDKYGNLKVKAT